MAAATSCGNALRHGRATGSYPQSLGLPPSDVASLRFVMGGLESLVGLGSNFGAMCQRLAEGTVVGAAQAEPDPGFNRMHVHAGHAPYRVDELTKIEAWSCWSNHASGGSNEPLGRQADVAYHALVEMVERDQKRHVVTLYLMYSDTTPASRRSDFGRTDPGGLADLVPLALETDTVLQHAKAMTVELRRALAERYAGGRMVEMDYSSRRPCRCPVHADDACHQLASPSPSVLDRPLATDARSPGDRDKEDGCQCAGPAPHLWMLCPNREGAPKGAVDALAQIAARGEQERWLKVRGPVGRSETVEPLAALHDLLDPLPPPSALGLSIAERRAEVQRHNDARIVNASAIRADAHQMLVAAAKSYRIAKARVTR